ncbi:nuclear transport factor 2 family protein [Pedobacter sandarakinus]|uniref:nuclear transport factor 2 family protein n=1 Tax=Pedobacter sandarakinus TaxID=353156 RepID=UPI002247B37F|nr:nuclear transport factor 2 family protein [Pedobacter sandarakinus]MCX2575399.1 nuclear transport factor 2 family protein [Pedobacter sandarakinus]
MPTTRELISKINKIFEENKIEEFITLLSDDIVWEMHSSSTGHTTLSGKNEIKNMGAGDKLPKRMFFKFGTIIIDGEKASVECTTSGEMPDGSQYKGFSCDIYHFSDEKVVRIISYVVDGNMQSSN